MLKCGFVAIASMLISILGLGSLIWSSVPSSWHQYLEHADGPLPLLILFLVVPAALGILGLIGFVGAFWILSHFATREEAQTFLASGPFGGHIGRLDRKMLLWFK